MFKRPLLLPLLLTACMGNTRLSVYNQPINKKYYASVHAETPDPKMERGEIGQRLVISWDLPYKEFHKHQWQVKALVQFGDRTEETKTHTIGRFGGDWILKWAGRPYIDKRGIVSYKAELLRDGVVVDTFQHQLWCELIRLDD